MDRIKQILINVSDSIPTITTIPDAVKESKHWWTDFVIPTSVSVTVFILGFLITFFYEKHKKRKELELYKQLIVEWVNDSKKSIDQYVDSLGAFTKIVSDSDSLIIAPYHTNLLCFEKLKSLPLEKLADALLVNLQTKRNEKQVSSRFFNLINQLEFLDKNSNLVMADYEKYCKENEQLRNEWNTHFIDLTKNIACNFIDGTISDKEYKFYEFSLAQQMNIVNMQKQNVQEGKNPAIARSIYMNNYIIPVYEYGTNNSEQFANSSKIQKTMSMLNEVKNVNIKYDEQRKYGDHFKMMNDNMNESKKILFESIEYYETHDIKSFWKIK